MDKIKLNREEKKHLEKIHEATSWRFTISVKEHFNKAGKLAAFAAAPTAAEEKAQKDAMKGMLYMSDIDSTVAIMKATDIFMSVARRVAANDTELAALLPAIKYEQKDVDVLEKCQMN
jgi:hypothetical protein